MLGFVWSTPLLFGSKRSRDKRQPYRKPLWLKPMYIDVSKHVFYQWGNEEESFVLEGETAATRQKLTGSDKKFVLIRIPASFSHSSPVRSSRALCPNRTSPAPSISGGESGKALPCPFFPLRSFHLFIATIEMDFGCAFPLFLYSKSFSSRILTS
jgi:hypothetical protein